MESLTTVTTKGQVTIPIKYRQLLGLRVGSQVNFKRISAFPKALILEPAADFSSMKGFFKSQKKYSKEKTRQVYLKEVIAGKV